MQLNYKLFKKLFMPYLKKNIGVSAEMHILNTAEKQVLTDVDIFPSIHTAFACMHKIVTNTETDMPGQ